MKKIILSVAVLSVSVSTWAQVRLTLEDCREMAQQNNAALKNAALDERAAWLQRQEALALYFPTASFSAYAFHALHPMLSIGITDILGKNDFAYNLQNELDNYASTYGINTRYDALQYGYGTMVSLTQPDFAVGRIINGNALAVKGLEAAKLQGDIRRRQTVADVEELWWNVVSVEDKLKVIEELGQTLDRMESLLGAAVGAGLAGDTELLKLRLKRSELSAAGRKAVGGRRLAKMNLFNAIGQPYCYNEAASQPGRPFIDDIVLCGIEEDPLSPEAYWKDEAQILDGMDEKKLLDIQVEAKELEKKMAIGEALPELGVGASCGYGQILTDSRFNAMAFASLKIPLTDWGKTVRKAQRIETQVQKARNDRDYLGKQLMLKIGKCWLDLTSAYDQWQLSRENSATARSLYDSTERQYEAGLVPLSDLLQAQTELSGALSGEVDALIPYRNAIRSYCEL